MRLTLLKILSFFLGHLPRALAYWLGVMLGRLGYTLDKSHRKRAIENLTMAFAGEKSPAEIALIARGVYENLAINAMELMRIPWLTREKLNGYVDTADFAKAERIIKEGRGLMACTAHFGNWELLAAAYGITSTRFEIVARKLDSPVIEDFVKWVRTRHGNRVIDKKGSMRELLKAINSGGVLGILMDQNVDWREGVFVDFFGKPACTNKGPATLALKTGTPVLPAFLVREGTRHRVVIFEELKIEATGDKERDVTELTRLMTESIERIIRMYPEQWFWVHRRWKTRAPKEV